MDENRKANTPEVGEENENLFARKKEGVQPASSQPAYSQRRASPAPRVAGNEETVVRRPAPSAPRANGQRPGVRPSPVANADSSRVPQCPPRQRPVMQSDERPQHQQAQQRPGMQQGERVQGRPASPASSPAYRQRRAPTGIQESLPTRKDAVVAPIPPAEAEKKPVSVSKKVKKADKEKKNDSHKNEKAGADMMVSIVKAIAYMVIVLVVSVFISIFVIRVGNDVFAFVKSDEAIDITIPEEADVGDIAEILSDNGIISFPGVFKMYATIKHDKGPFVAGDYTVSPSMSYDDLRYAFKEQVVTGTVWITIPEGYTTDEIIDLMVENGIGKREKYIDVINNYDFDYWFIDELEKSQLKEGRVYRLEGYLFPDTYEFYKSSSEEMVIGRLLKRFDEVFVEDYRTKAYELGYTVDEILTIASLVEKEAGGMGDFMYVSSVFHNRLNNPTYYPRLESDATTVYAIQLATGQRPEKVTPDDNKFEHPYNTYINSGLTPGPITNPSASAIRYALYPAKTGYYYFITDNAGKVYFASGITEHENNIALVKKINEQLENG